MTPHTQEVNIACGLARVNGCVCVRGANAHRRAHTGSDKWKGVP